MVLLWFGRSEQPDSALQLLYILDIIKFWAEYTYKPAIGACLSRLLAIRKVEHLLSWENTLWKSQLNINKANTPWLFHSQGLREAVFATSSQRKNLEVPLGKYPVDFHHYN